MSNYYFALNISFIIVVLLMPRFISIANKIGFIDKPTNRKKHKDLTPLVGGIVMYIGFFLTYPFFINSQKRVEEILIIFLAATLIIIIGLVDDYYKGLGKEFPIYPRVIIQILASTIIFKSRSFSFK